MILDIGKTYDFYYQSNETSWSKRGEVLFVEGCLAKIKDQHGSEETINMGHCHFESAREWKVTSAKSTVEFF